VQDLWLARLTHGQLQQQLHQTPELSHEARQAADRIDIILEDAQADARQALVTLQHDDDPSFGSLLRRFIEDYEDRFGLAVEYAMDDEPISLPGEVQAELLRICREALTNARKHAESSIVHVTLERVDDAGQGEGEVDITGPTLRLTIADDGRGFDASIQKRRRSGLRGMEERAHAIGARLRVDSKPMEGTRVTIELPASLATPAP
jgi:signal transduction histidine kinase